MGEIKRKISVGIIVDNLDLQGISTVVVNYCTHINRNRFVVTIFAGNPICATHRKQCKEAKIHICELPTRKKNPVLFYKKLYQNLGKNQYDIAHVHGNSATMSVELLIARLCGIKNRIAHCHNSTCKHMLLHMVLKPFFKRTYTRGFACSKLAGDWIFGRDNYTVISNDFETERYAFDEQKRSHYRRELKIEDCFVIGHVGRINAQKNHLFLIHVFETVVGKCPDARLILVGDGPDKLKIKKVIEESPARRKIVFYGNSDDVPGLLSAMDCFVLPSLYEGLPVVLLEAQAAGLPCLVSDNVSKESALTKGMKFLPLDKEGVWIKEIARLQRMKKEEDRERKSEVYRKEIGCKGYDIVNGVCLLEQYYQDCIKESEGRIYFL